MLGGKPDEVGKFQLMYESMRERVEKVVDRGKVEDEYISTEQEREAFNKWTRGSSRHDHPTVIQVLLESGRDEDITGRPMPTLIYVSREKSRASPHHFKAGALNVLLRVSAVITNAPVILNLDCDNYSNDPKTLHRVLCYFVDPKTSPTLAYVQFPQRFPRLDKDDIYACEFRRVFHVNPKGMDGLVGPDYFGSGTFFSRRAFFGGPSSFITPATPELRPDRDVDKPIEAQHTLALAHRVAGCNYDYQTNWGSKLGFRYGSLVEDFYTGYRLHCEGWRSVLCSPERAAFWGDAPMTLNDAITQTKRWVVGLLEVSLSKYCPLTYGLRHLGPVMALCYIYYSLGPILSIPITVYAFLPQLALLNGISIFPKVSCTWVFLYAFLFLGSYGQDCLEFILAKGTFRRWWNDQRMWMVRGITCNLFGSVEYVSKCLGMSTQGFNVTSKVVNDEQSKTYEKGVFEFGVESLMFVPLAATSMINLAAFIRGLVLVFSGGDMEGLFVQVFISGFVVLNCWPIYEAMALRRDKGRMPTKITLISAVLALALYAKTA
ncbi:Cellulose synthase (UDP-forming) [Bertholletia excelsa]